MVYITIYPIASVGIHFPGSNCDECNLQLNLDQYIECAIHKFDGNNHTWWNNPQAVRFPANILGNQTNPQRWSTIDVIDIKMIR